MTVQTFQDKKQKDQKISMLTCYDYWTAQLINGSEIDAVLVGDSLSTVMHGHETTIPATVDLMSLHTSAVKRGAPDKFIISDMPFMSYRKSRSESVDAVESLMRAGAHAVKLEGVAGNEEFIRHITESGVPVMGHLGLTPQSIHQFGGYKVQGRDTEILLKQAQKLQEAGCFAIVLECVPGATAGHISRELTIPTIGIGAGPETNGQVLVLQDMLGVNNGFKPKFLREFMDGCQLIQQALNDYDRAVKTKDFPRPEESYE